MTEQDLYNKIVEGRKEAAESQIPGAVKAFDAVLGWFEKYLNPEPKEPFVAEHGYVRVIEMTEKERVQWYLDNVSKKELAEMLAHRETYDKLMYGTY